MTRKDAGIRRSTRTPDRVFSFKLSPDNAIEGPIIKSLDEYRDQYPDTGLRQIVVDVFSRIEFRPATREDALLEIQNKMDATVDRLLEIIDKLMRSGASLTPATAVALEPDAELDMGFLARVQASRKRS